ncbi:MAG TPA: hypothetical protein VG298_16970 [Acidimicrobiales bacterium]|jgi:hypothetical protein|nr:hypothetical protein [Acidimicrobiales bacterium]
MNRKTRIAAALSAPVIATLAVVGFAAGTAAPAGAASPISITSHNITILIPPVLYLSINI